ncbi:MAG: Hpt domain-containing protein, partial [Actinomycetota bacterium]|nr:Hpt domain-containing protein [Actinomycetota bacterium]
MGDDLAKELMAVFALEAGERVQTVNEHLLALEKALGVQEVDRLLAEIFREAHSLKGAARAVNLTAVEAVAHRLESLLLGMQSGSVGRDRSVFDVIYEAVDAIARLAGGASAGGGTEKAGLERLCERLDAAAGSVTGASAADESVDAGDEPAGSVAEPAAEFGPPQPDESVRVTTDKLDAMLASAGELLAARSLSSRRRGTLRELIDDLRDWQRRWTAVRPVYRALLLAPAPAPAVPRRDIGATGSGWDDLLTFLEDNERRLRDLVGRAEDLGRAVELDGRRQDALTADLHDDVRRTRMMPVQVVLRGLPRMVRDLSHGLGKPVSLRIEGAETEVDRSVLERLGPPLTHLLRNCLDHGIEDPEARRRAGKPEEATILVSVAQRGDAVRIEVGDDGAGIDVRAVVDKAVERAVG